MGNKASKPLIVAAALCVVATMLFAFAMPATIVATAELVRSDGIRGISHGVRESVIGLGADAPWPAAVPESVDLAPGALDVLERRLKARGTTSLIVARNGHIAREWHAFGYSDRLYSISALSKGATASLILMAALDDGLIELDERAAKYIPQWREDPLRSRITVRHLASHSSGLDNIDFTAEHTGWVATYLDNEDQRFNLAIERTPVLFEPGTRFQYSGVGFYVLAYVLASAVHAAGEYTDLHAYLNARVMQPVGIPAADWSISYGKAYAVDGMTLHAIGSGGRYTPRALARIGKLMLQGGEWNGRQIIDPHWVAEALRYSGSSTPPVGDLPPGLGWWVNSNGVFPSLPLDAAVAIGAGQQVVLVVPSLRLVVVRLGRGLAEPGDGPWESLERELFEPLMAAVLGDTR